MHLGTCLAWCINTVLNVKALVVAFNPEKALVEGPSPWLRNLLRSFVWSSYSTAAVVPWELLFSAHYCRASPPPGDKMQIRETNKNAWILTHTWKILWAFIMTIKLYIYSFDQEYIVLIFAFDLKAYCHSLLLFPMFQDSVADSPMAGIMVV